MSYCRWSSENFKSDLYVYADCYGGWTIHVAATRILGAVPPIDYAALRAGDTARYVASSKAQSAYLDAAKNVPIGLPFDGKTLSAETALECATRCAELQALGYRVPDGVIDALREEELEPDQ